MYRVGIYCTAEDVCPCESSMRYAIVGDHGRVVATFEYSEDADEYLALKWGDMWPPTRDTWLFSAEPERAVESVTVAGHLL
jgi:hypothetical protein